VVRRVISTRSPLASGVFCLEGDDSVVDLDTVAITGDFLDRFLEHYLADIADFLLPVTDNFLATGLVLFGMLTPENGADNRAGGASPLIVRGLVADGRADHPTKNHRPEVRAIVRRAGLGIDGNILGFADPLVRRCLADIACHDGIGPRDGSDHGLDAGFRGGGKRCEGQHAGRGHCRDCRAKCCWK